MRFAFCFVLLAGCSSQNLTNHNDLGTSADLGGAHDLAAPGADGMMSQMSCDPVAQDCASASQRCIFTLSGSGANRMLTTQCVADGTVMRDQSCTVDMTSHLDNCQKGLVCTGTALPMGMSDCRKFCKADADCGAGQMCHGLFGAGFGECLPTCTAFGTDCGAGMTCAGLESDIASTMTMQKAFLACRTAGAKAAGDDCARATECGADMLCVGPQGQGLCAPLCDSGAHAKCPTYGADGGAADAGVVTTCLPYRGINVCE